MVSARTAVRVSIITFSVLSMDPNLSKELNEMLSRFPKALSMSDVAVAQSLLHETWPRRAGRPAKVCIGLIFDALKRRERSLPREEFRQRPKQWTDRRVRSIWEGTARRLDNFEMVDLESAAVEAARVEYRESIERSERLARFISSHEEARGRAMAQ